ncbi:MAG: hypothetical protein D6715_03185, partial [Calditrichaeota bacterium]
MWVLILLPALLFGQNRFKATLPLPPFALPQLTLAGQPVETDEGAWLVVRFPAGRRVVYPKEGYAYHPGESLGEG